MGKISLPVKSKKADNVEGLIKPYEKSPPPKKTALDISQHPSPTPKHPLSRTKAGCCRRTCLFNLGMLVVLVLFMSTACLVDYQQGNLATHTSQLPKEVREFPRQVGKYVRGGGPLSDTQRLAQNIRRGIEIFNINLDFPKVRTSVNNLF